MLQRALEAGHDRVGQDQCQCVQEQMVKDRHFAALWHGPMFPCMSQPAPECRPSTRVISGVSRLRRAGFHHFVSS